MINFIVGDMARLGLDVSDVSGALADPSSISLRVRSPVGVVTTLTGELVKDAVGKYHFDLALDENGYYQYQWVCTGQNRGVTEGGFLVAPKSF